MRPLFLVAALALGGCVVQQQPVTGDPGAPSFESQVPGRYVADGNGRQVELILNPDGSGSLDGQPGQWTIQLGQLMLGDGQQWAPATLANGVLTVQTPEGTFAFHREDVAAGGPPGGVGAPDVAPTAPAGAVDPAMVGCWEDYTGSNSHSGSGSYQSTLTLGADGTYARRTFSSVSAGGQSFVDDRTETGWWRVEGGLATFTPQDGQPTQLEVAMQGGMLYLGNARHLPCR